MRIEKKGLEKLTRDLKRLRSDILRETVEYMTELSKALNESYTKSIDEMVYEQYDPISYQRTHHLRGAHGARVEFMQNTGDIKKYKFYIEESSVDPIDRTTWKTKADNIEDGASKMTVGFNRPFISETQRRLEWETNQIKDTLIRRYEFVIKRMGG